MADKAVKPDYAAVTAGSSILERGQIWGTPVTMVKATKTERTVFVTSFWRLSADAAKRDSEIRRLRDQQIWRVAGPPIR